MKSASANTVEEEIQKEQARIVRLKDRRNQAIAIEASVLLRKAIEFVEQMDLDPGLTKAIEHLATGAEMLAAWEPGRSR